MNFEFVNFGDVGPIKSGMSRDDVRSALGADFDEFFKGPDSTIATDAYDSFGLHVYYDESYLVKGVEFLKWSVFLWKGQRIVGQDLLKVQCAFEQDGEVLNFNSSGFDIERLGLRFYAPDIGERDAMVEAVYVSFIRK